MAVYRVTGIATLWTAGRPTLSFELGLIHLIPFSTFPINHTHPLNVILFIPLGFLLPMIWQEFRSLKKVALAGFLLSLAIELNQLFSMRGTAIDDLLANTLGSIIGYLLFRLVYAVVCRREKFIQNFRSPLRRIKHEAGIYLVCSFMGFVLIFNPNPLNFNSWHIGQLEFASQDHLHFDSLEDALLLLDVPVLAPPTNLPQGFTFSRATFTVNPLLYEYLEGERGGRIPARQFLIIKYTNDDDIIELRIMPITEHQFMEIGLIDSEIIINGHPANIATVYVEGTGYLHRLAMWSDGMAYIFHTFSEVVTPDNLIEMAESME